MVGSTNLIAGLGILRGEEPEEQAAVAGGRVGKETGVGLANVEIDLRNARAIDQKFCDVGEVSWDGIAGNSLAVLLVRYS